MQSYRFFKYQTLNFPFLILERKAFDDIYQADNQRNRKKLRKFANDKKLYNVRNDRIRQ